MIVLDTDVVSEPMGKAPAARRRLLADTARTLRGVWAKLR